MTKIFVTGKGEQIQIGRELGKGGEGSIYELMANVQQVAKLYNHQHLPDLQKQAKLRYMVATADDQLLNYAAWPQETLHKTRGGPVIGFLMPKVTGRAPIHMLYSPAHRRQDYPKAAWDFLLFAARNTAAAFAAIHSHGHILGDVNQGNVMVGSDSRVVLIDCDSFQINANGETHLCNVGVSHFTPPELQGSSSFDKVKRTFNHDYFGLALLVFHILFGGRHPYSGVPLRKDVGEALETDIKAFRFAYARDANMRGIKPPPKSIPLSLVPDSMAAMFEIAFTERGASGGRPSSQQWMSALDALRGCLKCCGTTAMHVYPNHLSNCPWCTLEDKGVVYFIDIGLGFSDTATGFVLSRVWTTVNAVPAPPPVTIPNIAAISVTPSPLPPGMAGTGLIVFLRIIIACGAVGLLVSVPGAWFLIGLGAWIAWSMAGSVGKSERKAEHTKRRQAWDEANKEFKAMENRIRKETGPEGFDAKKRELLKLRDEYQSLPAKEKNEIEGLHATAEVRQKQKFLERYFIDTARISGVGPSRKAALRSFGIETAADVDWHKVRAVEGFGEVFTRAVVDWKKSCEHQFVFNPHNAVSEADKNAVRVKIATRKRTIEAALSNGALELQRLRQDVSTKANALYPLMNAVAKKFAQAQADLSLL